ncbi:MAG TPA: SpoIIE family protein phosphatase, partial [Planctomycetota bacterium]|nr:SpoIIE family protein phosphatase [Planctomycetota bacterium]
SVIPSTSLRAGSERVLLVGESSPEAGSLRAQLDTLACTPVFCEGPDDAIALVENAPPDLVIIDATAGDVDAYRLALRIRELTETRVVPVMLACAPGDLRAQIESRELGLDDCFAKPIDTEALDARIRLLLRNAALQRALRAEHRACLQLNDEITSAQEAIDRELELAGRIQRSLLPRSMPDLERFQFAAVLRPFGPVCGDFYDVYRLDETHWGFYVADAIGHGVPAALLTIFVKKGIRTREITPDGYRLLSPGEVLLALNRDLIAEKLSTNPFITVFYAILDVATGEITYASGGHPPAMLLNTEGGALPLLSEGALLGIFESEFTTGVHRLEPGETVVLYTDGIESARGPSGREGLDALIEYLAPRHDAPDDAGAREAFSLHVDSVFDALLSHDVSPRRCDDATVVALRRLS